MIVVHDPTEYQVHFFAIPGTREPGEKLDAICEFLNAAAADFARAVGKEPPYRILQRDDLRGPASDRLTFVRPSDLPSGRRVELDVRTLYDAIMLRTSALHRGKCLLDHVKEIRFTSGWPHPQASVPGYLGVLRVLYVEIEPKDEATRLEAAQQLAKEFGWTWFADSEPAVTTMGTLLFGFYRRKFHEPPQAAALDLIFVGGRDTKAIAESYPLHPFLVTLPILALYHLKVRHVAECLQSDELKSMADSEHKLRELLPKPGQAKRTLLQMLDHNDDITSLQAEVEEDMVQVRERVRTLRTNCDNFVQATTGPFQPLAERLRHLLIDPWMAAADQAEVDLGYLEGAVQLANTHFQSIGASAAADQARYLGKINRWQIFLATVGVGLAVLALAAGIVSAWLGWEALKVTRKPAAGAAEQQRIGSPGRQGP